MGYYNVPIGTSLSWTIYGTGLCKLAVSSGSFQAALQSHSVMPKDWKLCKPPPSQIFSRKLSLVLISSVQKASFKTLGLNAWVTMHTWKGCLWNGRKLEKQEPDLGGWPIAVAQTCRWVCWLGSWPQGPSLGASARSQLRASPRDFGVLQWVKSASPCTWRHSSLADREGRSFTSWPAAWVCGWVLDMGAGAEAGTRLAGITWARELGVSRHVLQEVQDTQRSFFLGSKRCVVSSVRVGLCLSQLYAQALEKWIVSSR